MRDGCSGSERTRRAGRVEDPVVGSAEVAPEPHPRLVTGDQGGQDFPSRDPGLLSGGERGREDHSRRVEDGGIVQVILLYGQGGSNPKGAPWCALRPRREYPRSEAAPKRRSTRAWSRSGP